MKIKRGTLVWTNKLGYYDMSYPEEPIYLDEGVDVVEHTFRDYITSELTAFKITSKHKVPTQHNIIWMKK